MQEASEGRTTSSAADGNSGGVTQPLKLLLVDDSEDDALLLVSHLRRSGYAPQYRRGESAEGLNDALASSVWDIALCDINMPRFDANSAMAILKAHDPNLPCIVASGTIGEELAADLVRGGAADLVLKTNLARLVPAIQREIVSAGVRRDQEARAREVELLLAVTRSVAEAADFDGLLQDVLARVCEDMGWAYGEAWLRDPKSRRFRLSGPSYTASDLDHTFREASDEMTVASDAGPVGRAAKSRRPVWIGDATAETHGITPRRKQVIAAGFRAILAVPIVSEDEVLTVLVFMMTTPLERNDRQVAIVSAVSLQLGSLFARKRAEARLRDAVESLPYGFALFDGDDRLSLCNDNYRDYLGWIEDDGMSDKTFPEILRASASVIHESVFGGDRDEWFRWRMGQHIYPSDPIEIRYVDDRWAWVLERRTREGGTVTTSVDVTDLKHVEEALRDRERALERALAIQSGILNALPAQVALLDSAAVVMEVNDRWRALTTAPDGQGAVVGADYVERCRNGVGFYGAAGTEIADGIRSVLAGERESYSLEYPFSGHETEGWNSLMVAPMADGAVVMHIDITDRKRAELALAESEARFQNIATNLPGFIFRRRRSPDGQNRFIYVSPSVQEFFGIPPDDFLADGEIFNRTIEPEDVDRFLEESERSARDLTPLEIEYRVNAGKPNQRWLRSLSRPQRLPDGSTQWDGIGLDVTDQKLAEERLNHLALHDPLTELPNRSLFEQHLQQAIHQWERGEDQLAIHYVDLDHFKDVNDTFGHEAGDRVIAAAGQRLRSLVRRSDIVARLSGDEFAVLQLNLAGVDDAAILAEKVVDHFSAALMIDDLRITIGASVGIAILNQDPSDTDRTGPPLPGDLLARADIAMHEAKAAGRSTFRFHAHEIAAQTRARMIMRQSLHDALENQEFRLHYQPQVDLRTGKIAGSEALIRWEHPERGLQRPDLFMAIAEDSGLIVPIGEWVLKEACRQSMEWRDAGYPALPVSVNVSAVQIIRGDFYRTVRRVLDETRLKPWLLELELTETSVITGSDTVMECLHRLDDIGVRMAIDDFGTGYSSFQYLKTFPATKLKIDQSFVRDMTVDSSDASIVRAIIEVGRSRGFVVVAEGVETEEQTAFLCDEGCTFAQGYHFSRPLPASDFGDLLRRGATFPVASHGPPSDGKLD